MLIHSGGKPYACTQCSYSCTQADDLKKHLLAHSGEKPFVHTTFWLKTLTTPQNLKMHNAHPFVQEKGISDVSSATILAIVLVISRITSPRTLEKNSLPVSNATTLAVTQIVWSVTCFHTLARNLLPENTEPRHLQTFKSFEEAYGKAWCQNKRK